MISNHKFFKVVLKLFLHESYSDERISFGHLANKSITVSSNRLMDADSLSRYLKEFGLALPRI